MFQGIKASLKINFQQLLPLVGSAPSDSSDKLLEDNFPPIHFGRDNILIDFKDSSFMNHSGFFTKALQSGVSDVDQRLS